MARVVDTIMNRRGYAQESLAAMTDLKHGGQFGSQTNFATYNSNAPYVRKNTLLKAMEAPRGFDDLDSPELWIQAFKTLVEEHPKTVEGINLGLTVSTSEVAFGGSGEMQQAPTKVSQARTEPVLGFDEKYGMPIHTFLNGWIRWLIGDPVTGFAAVISRTQVADFLPDYIGGTILAIEPDPTYTYPMKAVLITNFWPLNDGTIEMSKDQTADGQFLDLSIQFSGLAQHGYGVKRMAMDVMSGMNKGGMNPNLKAPFINRITADLNAAGRGYTETLNEAARTALTPQ